MWCSRWYPPPLAPSLLTSPPAVPLGRTRPEPGLTLCPARTRGPCDAPSAPLPQDKQTGKSRGIAMIRFPSIDVATSVIGQLNGQQIEGVPRLLEVKFADK